mmetsp:Transcript_16307/g.35264  ORF Transcript_16307/g.35264 Transcript_16307/m.35264 type:complete len:222 (-) Transcript_16307:2436-3101(-)
MRRTSCLKNSSTVTCTPGSSSGSRGTTSPAARTARLPAAATLGMPCCSEGCSSSRTARMVLRACLSSLVSCTAGSMLYSISMGSGSGMSMARRGPRASMLRRAATVVALLMTRRRASDRASRLIASMAATSSSTISSCAYEPSLANTTLSASLAASLRMGPSSSRMLRYRLPLTCSSYASAKVGPIARDSAELGLVVKALNALMRRCSLSTSSRLLLPYSS